MYLSQNTEPRGAKLAHPSVRREAWPSNRLDSVRTAHILVAAVAAAVVAAAAAAVVVVAAAAVWWRRNQPNHRHGFKN